MKSHPGSEFLCTSWALFKLLTCLDEISSREWVAVHLLGSIWIVVAFSYKIPSSEWVSVHLSGSIWIADMSLWNPIQQVSCCAPPRCYLNCWHALMKFHLGSELLCTSWGVFDLLTCPYEISSRLWVAVHLLACIWITDMPLWNPIQIVSCCAHPGLYMTCWHASMTSHPGGELLHISWALFELWTYPHEILSRMWVAVYLLGFIWIADMPLWNLIQDVSCCAPPGLHFHC